MARAGRRPNIYMATACDGFDTPLFVADNAMEMAAFLGCSEDSFYSRLSKHRKGIIKGTGRNAVVIHAFTKEPDDYEEED